MEKTANEIQKERSKEIEEKADQLLQQCSIVTLTSINELGYPRSCVVSKITDHGFKEIYFMTSKRSHLHGKATHFEHNPKASVCYYHNGNSVTLIGNVDSVVQLEEKRLFAQYCDQRFFKHGVEDPRCVILKFTTIEATFWIDGKFRTCKYSIKKNKR